MQHPNPWAAKQEQGGVQEGLGGRLRPEHPRSDAPKSPSPKNKAAISLQMQNNRRAMMIYFSSPVDKPASERGLR